MLRAEVQWLRAGPTLKMEGQLVGEWAERARRLVTPDVVPKGLIVDMNGVSCVDAAGEHLLTWLASLGAVFTASTICAIAICERLGLPTAQRLKARRDESTGEGPQLRILCRMRQPMGTGRGGVMSWFHACTIDANARNHSTAAEIVACFRDKQTLLIKLALLITGDHTTAEQAVANACEITIQGNSPFRDWLFEWAKAVTMTCAITSQGNAIRAYEVLYKDRRCPHIEHLCQLSDERRTAGLQLIFQMDEQKVVAELDPLCRAILVLRTAIRSSIQDCSLRLNVSRSAAAAANCLAMTWLDYRHMKPLEDDNVQADIGSRQSGRAPSS